MVSSYKAPVSGISSPSRFRSRVHLQNLLPCFAVAALLGWRYSILSTIANAGTTVRVKNEENDGCRPMFDASGSIAFRPFSFFNEGAGKAFQAAANRTQKDLDLKRRFLWYTPAEACPFVYYHIHKNGGGTMSKRVPISVTKFNSDAEREMGSENYTEMTTGHLQIIHDSQAVNSSAVSILVLSFLRDPLDRFLSSLGQVLSGPPGLLRECLTPCQNSMTTTLLIECVLNKMERSNSFLDEHFAPQSYELYLGLQGFDIEVHLFSLSSLSDVVVQLGGSSLHNHENAARENVENYPQFLLATSALADDARHRICSLYNSDVLLLQETHTSIASKCSEYLAN